MKKITLEMKDDGVHMTFEGPITSHEGAVMATVLMKLVSSAAKKSRKSKSK